MTAPGFRLSGLLLLFSTLLLTGDGSAQTADLEIVSIVPSSETVATDETFQFTVRIRNAGPDAAQQVSFAAGVNGLSLFRGITRPAGWTCDGVRPAFGYAVNCSTSALAALAEASFVVTLSAPQHTAMTYRLSARAVAATADPQKANDSTQRNLTLRTSDVAAELELTGVAEANGRAQLSVRNNGPDNAPEVTVVVSGTRVSVSGHGWKCEAPGTTVACTLSTLAAGATSVLNARATDATQPTAVIESRVRAEKNYDRNGTNNATTVTVVPVAGKSKRRATRP